MNRPLRLSLFKNGGLLGVLIVLIAVFSLRSENFFQKSTFISIANQVPDLTFLAVGMTFVLV
ncbi:MAG: ABC transporter permease, partial [Planctomycetota bacterium]